MDMTARPTLATWLATPDRVASLFAIAENWRDLDCHITLAPLPPAPASFGAHLRRSYLAALAPGASDAARNGQPCPWDPPCALDLFLREQLRVGGDGLPKPYVLFWDQQGQVMQVTLRLFGTACDWSAAAFDAMTAALRDLPWGKVLHCPPPVILHRAVSPAPWLDLPNGAVSLRLVSPMDDEGSARPDRDPAARLLSRALRRVDALARWQGMALEEDAMRALTAQAHQVCVVGCRLAPAQYISPNCKGEKRVSRALVGEIDLPPLSEDLRTLLALAQRCHVGRHTNEGLGRIGLYVVG